MPLVMKLFKRFAEYGEQITKMIKVGKADQIHRLLDLTPAPDKWVELARDGKSIIEEEAKEKEKTCQ